jgi:molybdate-binding protein/DNA-binding XRE family transcriptional regulator
MDTSAPKRRSILRELRLARGLTQEALAGEVDISRQAYAALESGNARPSVDVALRLARALATTVERLFETGDAPGSVTVAFVGSMPPGSDFAVRLAEVRGRLLAFPARGRSGVAHADGMATPGPDGHVFVRPFSDRPPQPDLVVAGCDPAFALVADLLRRRGVEVLWVQAGSHAALEMLARGEVHVGGVHLMDPKAGTYNGPWVERLVPGPCTLIRFATWEECLLLAENNPLRVAGIEDVARPGTRFVNREKGSGSRALLDRSLSEAGMTADAIGGYHTTRAASHLDVAASVASGTADAGVGIRAAGAAYGLHALTLAEEPYDLVIPTPLVDLPAVRTLIDVLSSASLREQVRALPGYDTSSMGTPG